MFISTWYVIYLYIYISLCIYSFNCLFIYLLFRYKIFIFLILFTLRFFFDLVIFIYIMSICVCVNRTIDGNLHVVLDGSGFWADWHHCIIYSTRHSSLPEKEQIRKIFQSLNEIDKIIIIFIHS